MLDKETRRLLKAVKRLNPNLSVDENELYKELNTIVISFRRLSALRRYEVEIIDNNPNFYSEKRSNEIYERVERWEKRLDKKLNKYGLEINKYNTFISSVCTLNRKKYEEIYLI